MGVALGSVSELPLNVDGRRGEEEEVVFPTDTRERFAGVGPPFSRDGGGAVGLDFDGRPTPERHTVHSITVSVTSGLLKMKRTDEREKI